MTHELKTALITGSSSGIGFDVARAFLDRGANVVLNGRNAEKLNRAAQELGHPERVASVTGSIADPATGAALVSTALDRFGRVDVLVNNAGIFGVKPFVEVTEEEFRGAVDEALANLPRSIREYIENVPLLVEDWPSNEMVRRENVSPQILGLFLGVPRTAAGVTDQANDLDRVFVFKRNLEKICLDREDLIDQIQITVRHEVGHYLGLDEDDMERLGLA